MSETVKKESSSGHKRRGGHGGENSETKRPAKEVIVLDDGEDGQADVIVVVGGQEFHEHSNNLSYWSGYFRAELKKKKRFEFPDKDPGEWKELKKVMDPLDDETKVTMSNFDTILTWADELKISPLMAKCDKVLADYASKEAQNMPYTSSDFTVTRVLDRLKDCFRYALPLSEPTCLACIKSFFEKAPQLLTLDDVKAILTLMDAHEESYKELWSCFEKYLPASFQKNQEISTGFFPDFIYAAIEKDKKVQKMIQIVNGHGTTNQYRYGSSQNNVWSLKRQLASDHTCGSMFPESWKQAG